MRKDYYKILGVDKDASRDEIKKAYRKLSKEHHPDTTGGKSDDKFKDISEAYSTLSNEQKRTEYDNIGSYSNPFQSSGFNFGDMFGNMRGFGFDDIFNRANSKPINKPGSDIKITLDLTLDEIETGSQRKIKYKRKIDCDGCDGKGGKDSKPCMACNGMGIVTHTIRTPRGIIQQQTMCDNCGGSGETIIDKCEKCNGNKSKEIIEELTIDVPSGASDSILYKYNGKGHSNKYGTGNLLIHFRIKSHDLYIRQGLDLIRTIKLPFNILVQGGEINIDLLNNKKMKVEVQSMTQPGYMINLRGKGLPDTGGTRRGNIILKFGIDFPKDITDEEIDIISKLNDCPNFKVK